MEALRAAQSDWLCRLLDEPITRSGFSTWALRQCLPDIGLRNSKLPCDCGRLDAGFEGGTHCIQLASGHTRAILGGLLASWLECPVEETDDRGRKTRTTAARDNRRGIPQGSPISPLLANLYMRRFVLGWKMLDLLLREHSACRAIEIGSTPNCRSARAAEAQVIALVRAMASSRANVPSAQRVWYPQHAGASC